MEITGGVNIRAADYDRNVTPVILSDYHNYHLDTLSTINPVYTTPALRKCSVSYINIRYINLSSSEDVYSPRSYIGFKPSGGSVVWTVINWGNRLASGAIDVISIPINTILRAGDELSVKSEVFSDTEVSSIHSIYGYEFDD